MIPPHRHISEGRARLFTMGLIPLDLAEWLWADERLEAELAEKDRLYALHPGDVFVADAQSQAPQSETLKLIIAHCLETRPDTYRQDGSSIRIGDRCVAVEDDATPPLLRAARLVQEDLVLMQPTDDGWRLTAGCLCFPSSWVLTEKFGHRLDDIHAQVPEFGPDTRNATIMSRMFDKLRLDGPVIRWNYSLNGSDALYHPLGETSPRFEGDIFVRMERQTLRKLPETGAILFTIRIVHQSLGALEGTEEGAALAQALIPQIEGLSEAERAYKGLTEDSSALLARLRHLSNNR